MVESYRVCISVQGNYVNLSQAKYPIGSILTGEVRNEKLYLDEECRKRTGNMFVPLMYLGPVSIIKIGGE